MCAVRRPLLRIRPSLLAMLALNAWACSGPPADAEVQAAFLKANPTAIVTGVTSGQEDRDIVYKHIRFRTPASPVECEVVWVYTDAEPTWILSSKSAPAMAGTLCTGCTMKPCTGGSS